MFGDHPSRLRPGSVVVPAACGDEGGGGGDVKVRWSRAPVPQVIGEYGRSGLGGVGWKCGDAQWVDEAGDLVGRGPRGGREAEESGELEIVASNGGWFGGSGRASVRERVRGLR